MIAYKIKNKMGRKYLSNLTFAIFLLFLFVLILDLDTKLTQIKANIESHEKWVYRISIS